MEIKTCPMCGSNAELYFSAALECYGQEWHINSITCTNEKCGMTISLTMDPWYTKANTTNLLVETWNKLEDK